MEWRSRRLRIQNCAESGKDGCRTYVAIDEFTEGLAAHLALFAVCCAMSACASWTPTSTDSFSSKTIPSSKLTNAFDSIEVHTRSADDVGGALFHDTPGLTIRET